MAKVTNTGRGPRGLHDEKGNLVMIEAGQSADGDFSAAEVKDFKAMLAHDAGEAPAAPEEAEEEKPRASK